ncbi:hypothetical protein [Streptacidiphilus cavernicola]|uniref:Transposase n=1 Tax=Streptacidiphilus cavernicola TaxID=3342716 RepID=A0ABV6W2P3_9ACTN
MSNDYIQYQTAKYQRDALIRAAEQHRLVRLAAESDSDGRKGGAARPHPRGVRRFGRSPRPSAGAC